MSFLAGLTRTPTLKCLLWGPQLQKLLKPGHGLRPLEAPRWWSISAFPEQMDQLKMR